MKWIKKIVVGSLVKSKGWCWGHVAIAFQLSSLLSISFVEYIIILIAW